MTIWSEIQTKNIRSLGFRDIRKGVTLRRLVLWSLECNQLKFKTFGTTTNHSTRIYRIYPKLIKKNQKITTCNRLDMDLDRYAHKSPHTLGPNHVTPRVRPFFQHNFLFGRDMIQHGLSSSKGSASFLALGPNVKFLYKTSIFINVLNVRKIAQNIVSPT